MQYDKKKMTVLKKPNNVKEDCGLTERIQHSYHVETQ